MYERGVNFLLLSDYLLTFAASFMSPLLYAKSIILAILFFDNGYEL